MPKYVRISQSLPDIRHPFTYEGMKEAVNEIYEPELVGKYFHESDERPECLWGCGVYSVGEDGSLKLVEANWDSSD